MKRILPLFVLLFVVACTNPPSSPAKVLADSEITLTTLVQNADQALGAACAVPASDQCGNALTWHAKFSVAAKAAAASIKTARAQLSVDPANAQSEIQAVNAVIQQLNQMIQQGAM